MPGTYSVMVTDINGCKAGDTATITALNPLPAAFMPGDSSICSYGTLLLQPLRSFNNYLWNNGATSPTITISQPGLYWLQVQDNKNCIGRDSIQVSPKQCLEGFYIPGAFTPNGDGKNDNYKPDVLGNILQYRFTIYNRWGQAIFQTTDINKGWDGTYTGRLQDTNVFVWTCTYQFAGEKIQAKKGTFILIR
jgi:gliding motility-associated-like protein